MTYYNPFRGRDDEPAWVAFLPPLAVIVLVLLAMGAKEAWDALRIWW